MTTSLNVVLIETISASTVLLRESRTLRSSFERGATLAIFPESVSTSVRSVETSEEIRETVVFVMSSDPERDDTPFARVVTALANIPCDTQLEVDPEAGIV